MLQAKIITEPVVKEGKWGLYILIKTKVLKNIEDIAIFGKLNDKIASLTHLSKDRLEWHLIS